ncbi:zinc transporter 10 isoform X2 [Camelus ferus]|uniref:Zinc transporter 10 isoform X2 n=2 Tax=Camelus TaxID=9836 RepID=A0A8B8RYW2_CAMFR|nr:zinc transporter 10 isoform X2 [Camelus ferus]XP_045365456.1 zinc transporter 10 [Camelus bactrianus]
MGRYSGRSFRLILMCVVSILLFVMELVIAHIGNSLSLASDAFAVLSHLVSMVVGLAGVRASSIRRHSKGTFGLLRADVLGAFGNSVFAVALMFSILVEGVKRYINPQKTQAPLLVLGAGLVGLLFNALNYVIFLDCCYRAPPGPRGDGETGDSLNTQNEPEEMMKKEKKSEALNIRGVLLHVMGDALGSVVVVITAIIFYVLPLKREDPCNWQCYIDPSLTVVMVIIILSSAFPLIKETAAILLQMVPKGVNMEELMSKLSAVPGISSVHEVHIWELISGKIIATLHIKYQQDTGDQDASLKIREIFHNAGIHNVTIQFEKVDLKEPLEQKDLLMLCSSPCISKGCAKQLCCPPGALPLAHVNGCAEHNGCPPLDMSRSDGLGGREATEVAIEVSLAGGLSDHGQALSKTREDLRYVNSTHF